MKQRAGRNKRKRLGMGLTQVSLLIITSTLLLKTILPWLVRLTQETKRLRECVQTNLAIEEFARSIRRDARNSTVVTPKAPKVIFQNADGTSVEWLFDAELIERKGISSNGHECRDVFRTACELSYQENAHEETACHRIRLTPKRGANRVDQTRSTDKNEISIVIGTGRAGGWIYE